MRLKIFAIAAVLVFVVFGTLSFIDEKYSFTGSDDKMKQGTETTPWNYDTETPALASSNSSDARPEL